MLVCSSRSRLSSFRDGNEANKNEEDAIEEENGNLFNIPNNGRGRR